MRKSLGAFVLGNARISLYVSGELSSWFCSTAVMSSSTGRRPLRGALSPVTTHLNGLPGMCSSAYVTLTLYVPGSSGVKSTVHVPS